MSIFDDHKKIEQAAEIAAKKIAWLNDKYSDRVFVDPLTSEVTVKGTFISRHWEFDFHPTK